MKISQRVFDPEIAVSNFYCKYSIQDFQSSQIHISQKPVYNQPNVICYVFVNKIY